MTPTERIARLERIVVDLRLENQATALVSLSEAVEELRGEVGE